MELKDFESLSEINDFIETLDGLTEEDKKNLFKSMSEEFAQNAMAVNTVEFASLVNKLKALRAFLSFTQDFYTTDDYIKDFKILASHHIKQSWKVEFKKIKKDTIGVYVNNVLGCELIV